MMPRQFCLALAAILIVANLSAAQPGPTCSDFRVNPDAQTAVDNSACLDGPVFGFTFNELTGQLSPILGIPGTLRLDNPLELGVRLDSIHFSDRQTSGLAVSNGDRKVLSLSLSGRTISIGEAGLPTDPDKVSISSSGHFAALFYPALHQVLVSQLPEATVLWAGDASSISDSATALSVSDDGTRVLVGTAAGTVYSLAGDGGVQLVASMTSAAVIRFLRNSHDAVIADTAEKRLYYYSESAGGAWSFAAESEGVLSALDIAISSNNDRVFVVNEHSDSVLSIDLQTGQSTPIACNCQPRRLGSLQGSTLFQVTNLTDSSLLLFEPTDAGGDILFVPGENAY
jgi:hypothetical protein